MITDKTWRGGVHDFALRIGELRGLQEKLDSGPEEILNRIRMGNWRIEDLMYVLRFGLVGAGMDGEEAKKIVTMVFDEVPILEFKLDALHILSTALLGPAEDPVGEGEGEPDAPEDGNSAPSTSLEQ